MTAELDVVVIGGGISGLATAFYLRGRNATVEVLDAGPVAGGVIATRHRDGALIESGPNSTLDSTPLINSLLDELGIRLLRRDAHAIAATRFVVRGGRLRALPSTPGAFLTTSAFSSRAKLALLREPFVAPAPADDDESIAAFVRRRLGREFLDYAIDPFVSGVYAGDPDAISVRAAFPRLHALEQKYGSLIKGQIKGVRERRANAETAKNSAGSFSFTGGMQTLTDALARALPRVTIDADVQRIERTGEREFRIEGSLRGAAIVRHARSVVLAVPADAAARLVRTLAASAAASLDAVEYAPVAVVVSSYRRADVANSLAGFGFLVPKVERRNILGTLFSSSMFDGRAASDSVLLTTFVGGQRQPEFVAKDEVELAGLVRGELEALLGARGAPLWTDIKRWPRAIPQYTLGHLERIAALEVAEAAVPGLYFRGSYRGGVAVGDRIKAAHATAGEVARDLA